MTEEKIDETSEQTPEETSTKPSRAELLEEEGEIAADYLEELMDLADIDGDIDIDVADGRAQLSIVCEDDDDSNLAPWSAEKGAPSVRCRNSAVWRCRRRPVSGRG